MKRKLRVELLLAFLGLGSALLMFSLAGTSPAVAQAPDGLSNPLFLPVIMGGQSAPSSQSSYVVIGWNDLGMHCYDRDYSTLTVLPPYNNLFSQVIKRGDPPQVITTGVKVAYSFPDNTYSAGKTNFWDYASKIFGANLSLNIGLTGKGLAGDMDSATNHFVAEGVPVTEFSDSAPTIPDYFQLARIVAKDLSGKVLAQTDVVAPVSSEMRCDICHDEPSPTNFRMNILQKHDEEESTHLAAQANAGNPVLCAGCHADPALGMTGNPNLPSLSAAMHGKHAGETNDCYACHPGPNTQCLRDVMSTELGMTCTDCHVGGMLMLSDENRTPWVDEPRCADCHDAKHAENPGKLFKQSTGHGGLYCEACHNSTHAILTSREAKDNLQSIALQGYAGTIGKCTVCHLTDPGHGGPHQ